MTNWAQEYINREIKLHEDEKRQEQADLERRRKEQAPNDRLHFAPYAGPTKKDEPIKEGEASLSSPEPAKNLLYKPEAGYVTPFEKLDSKKGDRHIAGKADAQGFVLKPSEEEALHKARAYYKDPSIASVDEIPALRQQLDDFEQKKTAAKLKGWKQDRGIDNSAFGEAFSTPADEKEARDVVARSTGMSTVNEPEIVGTRFIRKGTGNEKPAESLSAPFLSAWESSPFFSPDLKNQAIEESFGSKGLKWPQPEPSPSAGPTYLEDIGYGHMVDPATGYAMPNQSFEQRMHQKDVNDLSQWPEMKAPGSAEEALRALHEDKRITPEFGAVIDRMPKGPSI